MRRINKLFLAACLLGQIGFNGVVMSSALAQDDTAQPTQRTEAEAEGKAEGYQVGITNFAIRPTAGAIFFDGNQKFTGGVLLDFNVLSTPWAKIGPAIGALYSSTAAGEFFNGVSTTNDDYVFQIPGNLKATFSPDPAHRLNIGVHGGANIIRSTTASGTAGGVFGGVGDNQANVGTTGGAASWDVHPNVGGDVDFALGTNADLTLRPDVTFLADFNMVTATLGLGLKL